VPRLLFQGYQGSCNGSCPWLKSESDYLEYMALVTLATGVFVVFRASTKSRRGEAVAKGVVFATIAFTLFVAWLAGITSLPGLVLPISSSAIGFACLAVFAGWRSRSLMSAVVRGSLWGVGWAALAMTVPILPNAYFIVIFPLVAVPAAVFGGLCGAAARLSVGAR